jgi:hypothetical protein
MIVRVKEPFIDWLRGLPVPGDFSASSINQDNAAYLMPDIEDDEDRDMVIEKTYEMVFEEQLDGFWTDESDRPKERTLEMFHQWFEIDFHTVVYDVVDGPLIDEEL